MRLSVYIQPYQITIVSLVNVIDILLIHEMMLYAFARRRSALHFDRLALVDTNDWLLQKREQQTYNKGQWICLTT